MSDSQKSRDRVSLFPQGNARTRLSCRAQTSARSLFPSRNVSHLLGKGIDAFAELTGGGNAKFRRWIAQGSGKAGSLPPGLAE
jgi:hypothetical protein